MNYKILMANGDHMFSETINNVSRVDSVDGIYVLYDALGGILFTSPKESVVYIKQI